MALRKMLVRLAGEAALRAGRPGQVSRILVVPGEQPLLVARRPPRRRPVRPRGRDDRDLPGARLGLRLGDDVLQVRAAVQHLGDRGVVGEAGVVEVPAAQQHLALVAELPREEVAPGRVLLDELVVEAHARQHREGAEHPPRVDQEVLARHRQAHRAPRALAESALGIARQIDDPELVARLSDLVRPQLALMDDVSTPLGGPTCPWNFAAENAIIAGGAWRNGVPRGLPADQHARAWAMILDLGPMGLQDLFTHLIRGLGEERR